MIEKFKKGQIVPKRLGLIEIHSKARHNIRFMCDVEVEGRTVRALSGGYMIEMTDKGRRIGRGKGSYKKENSVVTNVYVIGLGPDKTLAAFRCIPRTTRHFEPFATIQHCLFRSL